MFEGAFEEIVTKPPRMEKRHGFHQLARIRNGNLDPSRQHGTVEEGEKIGLAGRIDGRIEQIY